MFYIGRNKIDKSVLNHNNNVNLLIIIKYINIFLNLKSVHDITILLFLQGLLHQMIRNEH